MRNAINISRTPPTPKNPLKKITDAPYGGAKISAEDDTAGAPSTADNDDGSKDSKISPYSFKNHNNAPDSADNYAASPNSAVSADSLTIPD